MKQVECKKVENCFGGTHIYEYRLHSKMSEEFIRGFGTLGVLTFYRNFPRPFFKVVLANGITVKGVLNDIVIKVQYPDSDPQTSKQQFEKLLSELLHRQSADME